MHKNKETIVLKFGGTSISNPELVLEVLQSLDRNCNYIIVLSAQANVTNLLIELADLLKYKKFQLTKEIVARIIEIHRSNWKDYLIDNVFDKIEKDLNSHLKAAVLLIEQSKQARIKLISRGEAYSCILLDSLLEKKGIRSELIKANELINYSNKSFKINSETLESTFEKNKMIITQGFIYSEKNKLRLMERGGSDLSASLIANSIRAKELQIWTDVSGVYTADPRKFSNSMILKRIGFKQLIELSRFGAKLLHTDSILPAIEANIPVKIRNTFNPKSVGTEIICESSEESFSLTLEENYAIKKYNKNFILSNLRKIIGLGASNNNNFELINFNKELIFIYKDNELNSSFITPDKKGFCILAITGKISHEILEFVNAEYSIIDNSNFIHKFILSKKPSKEKLEKIHLNLING